MSEEPEPQDNLLKAAEMRFQLVTMLKKKHDVDEFAKQCQDFFVQHGMIEMYKAAWAECNEQINVRLIEEMVQGKLKEIEEKDKKIENAEENEGDVEIRDAQLEKAAIIARTSTLEEAIDGYLDVKHLTIGKNIDKYLTILRLCLAWNDDVLFKKYATETQVLIDKGGDWDRRNRFLVYQAAHHFRTRNFSSAATKFLDAIATFTASEVFDYKRLVFYTVIAGVVSLPRVELKSKIVDSPEVLQVIDEIPHLKVFLNSFYKCDYKQYFKTLVELMGVIRSDFYLSYHANYYLREARLRGYQQFLQSYRSVKLESMADSFGISVPFLDQELSSYISSNRLTCKIDKVNGVVEMQRVDKKNAQYHDVIKKGDVLLNRIQRLSRVITN